MRARFAKMAGVTAAVGAMVLGLAVAPASATVSDGDVPLVETIDGLRYSSGVVISADATTMFVLGTSSIPSATVDLASREITGHSSPVAGSIPFDVSQAMVAVGKMFAVATSGGYSLFELGTDNVEIFEFSQANKVALSHIVADTHGGVRAISKIGEFWTFDGAIPTKQSEFFPADGSSWGGSGVTADGMLYFGSYATPSDPNNPITVIVDMRDGQVLGKIQGSEGNFFRPVAFDSSGTSLWGRYSGDSEMLVNVNWVSGASDFPATSAEAVNSGDTYISGELNWFASRSRVMTGGTLSDASLRGTRKVGQRVVAPYLLPGDRGLVVFDSEMPLVSIVNAPQIDVPETVDAVKIGDSVSFTAAAQGLAMPAPKEPKRSDLDPDRLEGSIWQSSPDGTTWTDIAGADGVTLTLIASEASAQLEYRRHFHDAFWGEQNSASARMNLVQGPKITRADDLANGVAGKSYPSEIITATGLPGMTWSSADLPAGLSLNVSTGEVTGTAPKAGDYEFTVKVTDDFGTDSKLFHLKVTASSVVPPVTPPTTTPLPNTGGSDWGSAAGIAAALLALGAAGLIASRRRAASLKR